MADSSSDESVDRPFQDPANYDHGLGNSGQSDVSLSSDNDDPAGGDAPGRVRGGEMEVEIGSGEDTENEWVAMAENDTWHCAPFEHSHGPLIPLGLDAKPVEYFLQLFPDEVFDQISNETKRYARQKGNQTFQTSRDEIKAYIGILFLMGVISLPSYKCYWSTRRCLRQQTIADVMPRLRFETLTKYFHLNDSTTNPPRNSRHHDKLHKVRPVLENAKRQFRAHYYPHENIAVDEAMVKFRGRCSFLQYVPAKPCKWGIKAWALADSESFYLVDFDIYTGKNHVRPANMRLGTFVVNELVKAFYGQRHHVYFDNFFTSVELMELLQRNKSYGTGTVRKNSKGLPCGFAATKFRNSGEMKKWRKGKMMCVTWQEKKRRVNLLTTYNKTGNLNRRRFLRGGGQVQYPKPLAIQDYTENFNAVDKSDQMRSYYGIASKAYKWWKYLFWFVLDISLVNAFILYKEAPGGPRQKVQSHLDFHLDVAEALIDGFSSRKRRSDVAAPTEAAIKVPTHHEPTRIATTHGARICVLCNRENRHTPAGNKIQTCFECVRCGVALCRDRGCFARFHNYEN